MSGDRFDLQRFVDAQNRDETYEHALAELRDGRKRGHWIWFVFPQIAGLGRSEMSRVYAISSLDEARAYLAHELLGPRLDECAGALLMLPTRDPIMVLGDVDAIKVRSSMTLFAHVEHAAPVFARIIDEFYGGAVDEATERLIQQAS